jgi:hypothetical protein
MIMAGHIAGIGRKIISYGFLVGCVGDGYEDLGVGADNIRIDQ